MRFTAFTTKLIRQWLKENDFDCGCRLGKEFLYEPTDNYIMVQKIYDNSWDFDFIECLRDLGLENDFDCTTLSILHELGHFETQWDFTDDEWENDNIWKMFLTQTITNEHELNVKYWESETEKVANEWLVWFVGNYKEQVQKLEDIISLTCV